MTGIRGLGLCMTLALPAFSARAEGLRDAYRAFEKGQYEEAAKGFQDHAKLNAQDYDQLYNAGVALFKKGDYAGASQHFDRAKQSTDPMLKSRAAYNKGVTMSQQQNWEQAEAEFQEALSYDNDNAMIRDNLEFARKQKNQQKTAQNSTNSQQQSQDDKSGQNDKQQQNPNENSNANSPNEQKQAQNNQSNEQEKPSDQQQAQNGSQNSQNSQQNTAQNQKQAGGDSQQNQKTGQGQQDHQKDKAQQDAMGLAPQDPKNKNAMSQEQGSPQHIDAQRQNESMQQGSAALSDKDGVAKDTKNGQRVLTVKDLKKQEAEKLLRSVDDRIGTYVLTPEQANTEGKSRNGKDW